MNSVLSSQGQVLHIPWHALSGIYESLKVSSACFTLLGYHFNECFKVRLFLRIFQGGSNICVLFLDKGKSYEIRNVL